MSNAEIFESVEACAFNCIYYSGHLHILFFEISIIPPPKKKKKHTPPVILSSLVLQVSLARWNSKSAWRPLETQGLQNTKPLSFKGKIDKHIKTLWSMLRNVHTQIVIWSFGGLNIFKKRLEA